MNFLEHHHLLSKLDRHPALIRLAAPKILGFKTIPIFIDHWQDGQIKLSSQLMARVQDILEQEFPSGLPSSQKDLLELCLLFDHKAISYEFLEFLGLPSLQLFFGENSERFARHGLIETTLPLDQSVTCSISAILYQYLRQSVRNWDPLLTRAAGALAPKVPRSSKDNYRVSIELLAPHAEIFAKYVINTPKLSNPDAHYLDDMERIASLLRLLGNDRDAITLYGYIHQGNNDGIHRSTKLSAARTAELYNNMGLSCLNEGDIKFAQSCFDKATDALKGKLADSQTMLEVIANRARAHIEMEEYHCAVPLLVDSIGKFRTKDQDVLLPLQHALGFAHIQLNQTDLGVRILEQSCQTALESPRAGKRLAYSIMHDLATAYRDQKKWDAAINLYEKTREGRKGIHGPGHRYTIETTAALAVAYHGSDQRGKAAACFQEALKWQRENLRPNHPDTLQTLQNYGIFLYSIGHLEAARKALRLVHIGQIEYDEKIGKVSWKRINSGVSLALVLQGLKKFKESASLFEEAVSWHENHPSLESSKTAYQYSKTLYLQGAMYEEWTYPGQALESYLQADKVSDTAECEINYWKQLAKKGIERICRELQPQEPLDEERRVVVNGSD